MTDLPQIIQAVTQLSTAEQSALLHILQRNLAAQRPRLTREWLLNEQAALQASGAWEPTPNLHGRYARPDIDLSFEEIETYLTDVSRAWKADFEGNTNA